MSTLLLLTLLQLKHFLCDWVFQTDYQIKYKGQYMHPGGIEHSLQHAVLTALAVAAVNPSHSLMMGAIDGLIHYHVDWLKQNLCSLWRLTTHDKGFWVMIGADQLVHQITYLAITFLVFTHLS